MRGGGGCLGGEGGFGWLGRCRGKGVGYGVYELYGIVWDCFLGRVGLCMFWCFVGLVWLDWVGLGWIVVYSYVYSSSQAR